MRTSIHGRVVMAVCCAAIGIAVAAPAASATSPSFYGTSQSGELLTIEKVKKKHGKKKQKRKPVFKVTDRTPLTFTPSGATQLVGIDQRPINGELNGIGDNSVVYRINPATGIATGVAGSTTAPFVTALEGDSFGVDFNPTVPGGGAIRIVSDANYNHRVSPNTGTDGAGTPDADLNGGMNSPTIVHAAYTNSALDIVQPLTTELKVLDSANDVLYTQNPPNAGTLTSPLELSLDVTDVGGFDILGNGSRAYVASQRGGRSELHRLNIATGESKSLGTVRRASVLTGLAVVQR
jgi:Domain of unknown function (DUF4394)